MGKFIDLYEKMGATYSYSSVQIDIPIHIAREVIRYSHQIPKSLIYDPDNDKSYGLENEIHCTVLYGIHASTAEGVKQVVEKYRLRPFNLQFGHVSYFEQADYDVMKFDIVSPYLHKINSLMREELEYTNSFPEYKPHCTIAYLRKGTKEKCPFAFDEFMLFGREVWVTELTFSSKSGQHETVPLNGQVGRFRRFVEENQS